MAFKTFVAGEEALAADVNSYLMGQTVARFTNATQRTSQLAAPVANQLSILDSRPGTIQVWNGSAWVDLVPVTQGGYFTGTTNASGDVVITFPKAFAGTPYCNLTPSGVNMVLVMSMLAATTTQMTVRCFSGTAVLANTSVGIVWTAVGYLP